MKDDVVKSHYTTKFKDLGVQVGTILADNVLLAIWIVVEYCLEHYVVPRFPVDSKIAIICLWVFRVIFALSTLVPWAVFLYRDIWIICMRAQADIRAEAAELKGKSVKSPTDKGKT